MIRCRVGSIALSRLARRSTVVSRVLAPLVMLTIKPALTATYTTGCWERSAMKEPQFVSFEIEGAEMAVRLAGEREKPAFLLMHGLPNSWAYFRNVIGPLSQDCFVIAPDLPGSEALRRSMSPHSRVSRT
jgi:hypothetical protein